MRERAPLVGARATLPAAPGPFALAAAALAIVSALLLPGLATVWRTDEYAGHGPFVPVYAAFLLWMDRDRLRAAPRRADARGLAVMALGLALFAVGRSAQSVSLQVLSLAATLAGAVLACWGGHVLRAAAFPIAFLALMMPVPRPVVDALSPPIQRFAAAFASTVLALLGVPHFRSGITIELPALTLAVAEGCNGLRFLMALVTLTAAFAQATQRTVRDKAVLVAASVPLALIANDIRIAAVTLAGYYVGAHAATGLTHHSIGKGVWAMTLVPLALIAFALRHRRPS
jgi:exosortase